MKKMIQTQISLLSPAVKVVAPMYITYNDDEDAAEPMSEIVLVCDGIQYKGSGTDFLWMDTVADLQRKLPNGAKIACCITCRHGNMCPYGTEQNQLFCTKDLTIGSKKDICELFDSTDPFEKRQVGSFNCCDDFAYQSDAHYTYSDFLYHLNMKESE